MRKNKKASQPDDNLIAEMQAEVEKERQRMQCTVSRNGAQDENDVNGEESVGLVWEDSTDVVKANSSLPIIDTTNRPMHEISAEAVDALSKRYPQRVFSLGRSLSRVIPDDFGHYYLESYDVDTLRSDIDRSGIFIKKSGPRTNVGTVNDKVLRDILSTRNLHRFPVLKALISIPCLRPDGSILDTPGYDAATQFFYAPGPGLENISVPAYPTEAEIVAAVKMIQEPFRQMPFSNEASRSNATALTLTATVRPGIAGPVPMAVITSPTPGTGKSLIPNCIAGIASGKLSENVMLAESEAENQKRITSRLAGGCSVIGFDNAKGVVDSASLARLITEPIWIDRLLGGNKEATIPILITPLLTGNNVRLSTELARRSYPIRLDAFVPQPWAREIEYDHEDLPQWVLEYRAELVKAGLTLFRAYYVAGKPKAIDIPPTGNFSYWAHLIGGVLQFVGIDSFLKNLSEFYGAEDEETQQWAALLRAIHVRFGSSVITTADVAELDVEYFPEALADSYDKPSFTVKLGKAFAEVRERPFGADGIRIEKAGSIHGKVSWRVRKNAGNNPEEIPHVVELRPAPKLIAVEKQAES